MPLGKTRTPATSGDGSSRPSAADRREITWTLPELIRLTKRSGVWRRPWKEKRVICREPRQENGKGVKLRPAGQQLTGEGNPGRARLRLRAGERLLAAGRALDRDIQQLGPEIRRREFQLPVGWAGHGRRHPQHRQTQNQAQLDDEPDPGGTEEAQQIRS